VFLAAAVLLSSSFSFPAHAQEPRPEPPQIAVRVELVNVEVTVSDAQGNFVGDLKRENFRVLDEGVEQAITYFASTEAPAQVLVLVETGPAVYLIHREHLAAAYALLEGLAPDDRIALGTFDQSARLLLNFTADKNALAQALEELRYNLGTSQLNLFDGLAAALNWLSPVPGKKAIVLLGTGLDTSGASHWKPLEEKLRASGVVVLPVALGGELREPEKKKKPARPAPEEGTGLSFAQADRALEAIAAATGGRVHFPRDARDFPAIYRQIAELLRHQYSLGFAPPARNARYHRIEVQLRDANGQPFAGKDGKPLYRVSARPGYLAPPQ
jgi:VWFA-related protein